MSRIHQLVNSLKIHVYNIQIRVNVLMQKKDSVNGIMMLLQINVKKRIRIVPIIKEVQIQFVRVSE